MKNGKSDKNVKGSAMKPEYQEDSRHEAEECADSSQ